MKKGIISMLIVLILLSVPVFSMNDTDGVIWTGLFPINNNENIFIDKETIKVDFRTTTLIISKEYKVFVNQSTNYRLGTMICYNCTNNTNKSLEIFINDNKVDYTIKAGYLTDSGNVVKLSLSQRYDCDGDLDGTIGCHTWAEFNVKLETQKVTKIRMEYKKDLTPSAYFTNLIIDELYLYSEKFWSNTNISKITVELIGDINFVPIKYFEPSGDYSQYSIRPSSITDNSIIWKFDDYKPIKEQYTYTKKIVHPNSVDKEQICRYIQIRTNKSFCEIK